MNLKVRVYKDGRVCVPAPILREAWGQRARSRKTPAKGLPNTVFIIELPRSWILSWAKTPGSVPFDLSVRDRVLFGKFTPGLEMDVEITPRG